MRLDELQGSAIDNELAKTADAVKNSGENHELESGMDGMGDGGMDDPFGEEMDEFSPDGEMGDEEEVEQIQAKDIDSEVISSVSGMNFLDKYSHDEDSKIHPMRILQMEIGDLEELRKLVKAKIINNTIMDAPGQYDDDDAAFYQDLMSFVDKVMDGAKTAVKDADDADTGSADDPKAAKPKMQNAPANENMGEVKHNPNKAHKESRRYHRRAVLSENANVKLPKRYAQTGVGKSIGGKLYLHRQYEDVLPQEALEAAKSHLGGFEYNLLAYAPKTGAFTFTQSPDFDSAPEPSVGEQKLVKPDGTTRIMKAQANPWIYHHKWLWVQDNYSGFGVEESKRRSMAWMSLPDIDYARIGKKSFWEENVIPHLK